MRRATDDDPGQRHGYRISIHALHEESDMLRESEAYGPSSFQSTLSMRRATLRRRYVIESLHLFQSTLSMRRATSCSSDAFSGMIFQSTLSMRRATWTVPSSVLSVLFQSTLSMRRATFMHLPFFTIHAFQSTLSMRRATRGLLLLTWPIINFNPRSP